LFVYEFIHHTNCYFFCCFSLFFINQKKEKGKI